MLTKSPGITDEKNMKMFWRENDRVATGARALRLSRISALLTPEERLPSGAPEEEFGRMIFQKNLPWVTVLNHFSPKKI